MMLSSFLNMVPALCIIATIFDWLLHFVNRIYNTFYTFELSHSSSMPTVSECCKVVSLISVPQSLIHCPLATQKMLLLECKTKQMAPLHHSPLVLLYPQKKRFHPYSGHKALMVSLRQPL